VINGVNVTRFRSIAPHDAFYFAPQIYFYLKKLDCEIIHAHNYHALPALFAYLAIKRRRFVLNPYYHGRGHTKLRDILCRPYALLGSQMFSRADNIVCISRFEADLVCNKFKVNRQKISIIPPGLNVEEFQKYKNMGKITEKGTDEKRILYVGRLEEYKGVQYIIRALPHLEGGRLVIIGKGPYESELRELAKDLGVHDRIDWLRDMSRDELLKHYSSADVLVMLSKHESYGMTIAEALASGTPCVAANESQLSELIDGSACVGIKYPVDTRELAAKIETQMNLGKTVKTTVRLLSWDDVVDRLVKIYES
ncbi:MAG: glycosyltransferase family 4 protein, partial [Methanocellales archaeon]|nr:glycosyltransferase family 4 protein [Methanocellales archaeon]